jgi:hypothetical protein
MVKRVKKMRAAGRNVPLGIRTGARHSYAKYLLFPVKLRRQFRTDEYGFDKSTCGVMTYRHKLYVTYSVTEDRAANFLKRTIVGFACLIGLTGAHYSTPATAFSQSTSPSGGFETVSLRHYRQIISENQNVVAVYMATGMESKYPEIYARLNVFMAWFLSKYGSSIKKAIVVDLPDTGSDLTQESKDILRREIGTNKRGLLVHPSIALYRDGDVIARIKGPPLPSEYVEIEDGLRKVRFPSAEQK